ncbi:MAG: hypothetical protein Q8K36_05875, partial [Alphaproteobacteria bacterium]|nr:hypothetical protein [Alphaproteobacteria bacterium]
MKNYMQRLVILFLAFGGAVYAHTGESPQAVTTPEEPMEGIPFEYTQISLEDARSKASHEIDRGEGNSLFLLQMSNNIDNLVYQHA